MKRIFDQNKIETLVKETGIGSFFSTDILPHLELFQYECDDYLIREGEPLKYLYFLMNGKVKVYISLRNGKSVLLCFYEGVEVLGEAELVNGYPAGTTVQAIESQYCLGIPSEKVNALLLEDQKFLRYALNSISEKLRRTVSNSSVNLIYSLEKRLASYILAVSEKDGVFDENLTEISELLVTSYRHLLRTLNTLVQKGTLVKEGRRYRISDLSLLRQLASDVYHEPKGEPARGI